MQRIYVSESERKAYDRLLEQRNTDSAWRPSMREIRLEQWLSPEQRKDFLDLMSPDDLEDLVAYYLQEQGWRLMKSTCFRSFSTFEFQMIHRESEKTGFLQVKSGNVTLDGNWYSEHARDSQVFLFTTGAVSGESVAGVEVITVDQLLAWIRQNRWSLPPSLRLRMALVDPA